MGNGPGPSGLKMVVSSETSPEGISMTDSLRFASTTGREELSDCGTVPKAGASSFAYCCAPGNGSASAEADIAASAHAITQPDNTCLNAIPETPPTLDPADFPKREPAYCHDPSIRAPVLSISIAGWIVKSCPE